MYYSLLISNTGELMLKKICCETATMCHRCGFIKMCIKYCEDCVLLDPASVELFSGVVKTRKMIHLRFQNIIELNYLY